MLKSPSELPLEVDQVTLVTAKSPNLALDLESVHRGGQLENCLRSSNNLKIININFLPKKKAFSGETEPLF